MTPFSSTNFQLYLSSKKWETSAMHGPKFLCAVVLRAILDPPLHGFIRCSSVHQFTFLPLQKHHRKSLSVKNNRNSCHVIKENNNPYCLSTDRLFMSHLVISSIKFTLKKSTIRQINASVSN